METLLPFLTLENTSELLKVYVDEQDNILAIEPVKETSKRKSLPKIQFENAISDIIKTHRNEHSVKEKTTITYEIIDENNDSGTIKEIYIKIKTKSSYNSKRR